MVARIKTVAFQGVDTLAIDVQVQLSGGVCAFSVVGLGEVLDLLEKWVGVHPC